VAIPRVEDSPYCPVQAVSDGLVAAEISTGAVFRSMHRGEGDLEVPQADAGSGADAFLATAHDIRRPDTDEAL
jgi:hypothetical protein